MCASLLVNTIIIANRFMFLKWLNSVKTNVVSTESSQSFEGDILSDFKMNAIIVHFIFLRLNMYFGGGAGESFKLHWLFIDLIFIDFQEPHPLLRSNICQAYQRRRSCLTDRRHKLTRPAPSWLPWPRAGSRTPVWKHSWQSWTNISSITISSPSTFHPITP